jgi:Mycobacterial 4 TMS phage holin, superfamily IV
MIRFLVSIVINLIASAIGFIVAAAVLEDFTLNGGGFVVAVAVFTVAMALFQPFFLKMALSKARALSGGTALVSTFAALIVADVVSDGVSISGAGTWLAAAVIVWVASLIAVLIVPVVLVKMGVQSARARNNNN